MKRSHHLLWKIVAVFVIVTAGGGGLDWLSSREGMNHGELLFLDAVLTGAASAAFICVVLRRAEEREADLERRLKVAGQMNHHIRNALQPILYANTISPNEFTPIVRESVDRIEWALREVLDGDGEPQARALEVSAKIDKIHTPE